jgi:ABC-2 type transport system permease protein
VAEGGGGVVEGNGGGVAEGNGGGLVEGIGGAPARLRRNLWLYRRCLGAHLRSTLEYESDFWIMAVTAVLTQAVGAIFLWAIFRSVPQINGWAVWDVVLIYSLVVISEGIAVLVAQGAWTLSFVVNLGQFDAYLLRPFSPVLQVLSSQIGMNGLGNVGLGTGLLVGALTHVDVDWSPARIAFGVLLLLSAAGVKIGLNLVSNCAAFWMRSPASMFAFSLHTLGELTRFPLGIYSIGVQLLLSVGLPFAFMSFYPATAVLGAGHGEGTDPWLGALTPLVAIYCLGLGAWIFRIGLRRYESSGH